MKRTRFQKVLAFSRAAPLGFGHVREEGSHICPLPDWASLSTDTFAAPHPVSPAAQPQFVNLVWVHSVLSTCLLLSLLSLSLRLPEPFPLHPSLHGHVFPHLSASVPRASVLPLAPLREQKPFSQLLRQTYLFIYFWWGEEGFWPLVFSPHFVILL